MVESDATQDFAGDRTHPTEETLAFISQNKSANTKTEVDSSSAIEFDALVSELTSKSPHNPAGWRRLISLATNSGQISKIQSAYDKLLKQYPNTCSAQIAYISHFLEVEATFGEAEKLFIKFLRDSPSVELWQFYLTYVRRRNLGSKTRDTVGEAYKFALKHVGQDKDAGQIWHDYIQFLKAEDPSSTWEKQRQTDALRKAYHQAVQIPLDNVERLWSDLAAFENDLNSITAKRLMADLIPSYTKARTALRPLTNHLHALYPPSQGLFLPSLPTFDATERNLVGKWKAYLKWEESNPLGLENKETLIKRIQRVYRKAVIRMRFYPEIWYMAYHWTNSVERPDDALLILRAGIDANPASNLLTFAFVEAKEQRNEYAEVHTAFEKLLHVQSKILDGLEKNPNADNHEFNGTQPSSQSTNISSSQQSIIKTPPIIELQERRVEYGLVYILYMRFARRAEGLQAMRKAFAKARKDKWVSWEVYEACGKS
ncbi:hypothetical protein MD484_g8737, partial [Candolleomyces efflorescens]